MKTKPLSKNFSWEVKEQPLYINGNISNYKALIRSDNSKTLTVRTNKYHTFRNRELMRLADRIAAKGNFSVEGFDEFKGGKKVIGYLRNNLWGVFNGVTLYTSHYLQTRQYSLGSVSGVGEEINSKAMGFMEEIRRRN